MRKRFLPVKILIFSLVCEYEASEYYELNELVGVSVTQMSGHYYCSSPYCPLTRSTLTHKSPSVDISVAVIWKKSAHFEVYVGQSFPVLFTVQGCDIKLI